MRYKTVPDPRPSPAVVTASLRESPTGSLSPAFGRHFDAVVDPPFALAEMAGLAVVRHRHDLADDAQRDLGEWPVAEVSPEGYVQPVEFRLGERSPLELLDRLLEALAGPPSAGRGGRPSAGARR